jgi:hypothetical protein
MGEATNGVPLKYHAADLAPTVFPERDTPMRNE